MPEVLDRRAAAIPLTDALIFMDKRITYQELNDGVNRFANALLAIGVKAGDRVALLMPNIPQMIMAFYGAWKIGAVVVPNNPLYTDGELEYQFNNSGSTVLVTLDMLAPRMIALQPRTQISKIIIANIADYLGAPAPEVPAGGEIEIHQWMELQKQYPATDPGIAVYFNSLAILLFTGGTTGVSKGVMLTHANLCKDVQIIASWFPRHLVTGSVEISPIPIFHAYGLTSVMNLSIIKGWTNVIIPLPQPQVILEAIHKYRGQVMPAVPTLLVGMLSHPDLDKYDLTSLEGCFPAAAPVPVELINKFESLTGCQVCGCYGLSETSPCVTMNPLGGISKVGSIGIPLPDIDAKIVDLETGTKEVAVGETGELLLKGPVITEGYYNMPEETALAIKDGWLYTGDIARADEDGYLYIVDRKKDIIIAGGYNIYPLDIDNVLFGHPKIAEACAVGIPDEYRGETVKAFVVLNPGETMTEDEVIRYCKEKLAAYKVPRLVEFMPELPKTSVGKVLRRQLREMELSK
jgi:long-chain acyl-CoA synthetase